MQYVKNKLKWYCELTEYEFFGSVQNNLTIFFTITGFVHFPKIRTFIHKNTYFSYADASLNITKIQECACFLR